VPPFRGSDSELIAAHLESMPAPLSGVDHALQEIVDRALAKRREDRFPSMDAMAESLRRIDSPRPERAPRESAHLRRRWLPAVAVAACATAAAAALWLHGRGTTATPAASAPFTAQITGGRSLGDRRTILAVGGGAVLVARSTGPETGRVDNVDPATMALSPIKRRLLPPLGLANHGTVVWLLERQAPGRHAAMVRLGQGVAPPQSIPVGVPVCQLYAIALCNPVVLPGGAWAPAGGGLVEVGDSPLSIEARVRTPSPVTGLAYGSGYLWALTNDVLVRVDPLTRQELVINPAAHLQPGYQLGRLAVSGGNVWFSALYNDGTRDKLVHVEAWKTPPRVVALVPFVSAGALVSQPESLWAAQLMNGGSRIIRIDLRSGNITGPAVTVPDNVTQMGQQAGTLWVTTIRLDDQSRRLVRITLG
jgi:hypothetical protein